MKSFYYLVLLYFALFFTSTILPQIAEITRLPVQNPEQSIKESAPVWISENEIMIFYVSSTLDTIYSTKSNDSGISWGAPKVVQVVEATRYQELLYLTSLRSNTGRILLAWSVRVESMKVIHSDNFGENWSAPISVLGGGTISGIYKYSKYLNLTQLETGVLVLSFNSGNYNYWAYYRLSFDNGITWSEEVYDFHGVMQNNSVRELSIHSISTQSFLGLFHFPSEDGIFQRISTDGGTTWGDTIRIVSGGKRPRVVKISNEQLLLIYLVEDTTFGNEYQNDIYHIKSYDDGESWTQPERFTSYVGEDQFVSAVNINGDPFVTFSSTRFNNKPQISYAKIGETVENFRPPYITNVQAFSDSIEKKEWLISCKIVDDEEVVSAKVDFEDGSSINLYDDGNHNDGDSADNIFANVYSFQYFALSTTEIMNVNNIALPFNNTGILSDVEVTHFQNLILTATDNDGDGIDYNKDLEINYSSHAYYDDGIFLFSSGFGLSGYTNDELWANAQLTVSLIENYVPGRVDDQPEDPRNVIYTVKADEPAFGLSWQRWKDAVELGADFYDGDEDGVYNPVDKNWNGIWDKNEDMPDLLGDQTSWCVYNDGQPGNRRIRFQGVDPQGIEVHQTLFASANPELENVIFIRYKIINMGTVANVLDSVIFSFYRDPDIGYDFDEDLVGCDTILNSSICYKSNDDSFYGDNPPAFFTTLLQGPLTNSSSSNDTAYNHRGILIGTDNFPGYANQNISAFVDLSFEMHGGLNDQIDARNLSLGLTIHGVQLDPCNFYRGEVRGGVDCNSVNPLLWFSGDPVEDIGWINVIATDQRDMLSVGEFTLEKDKPVTIISAYVLGRGTDALNSITVARENVRRAILEYESNFASLTYNPGQPTYPVTDYKLYHNYPNPFNPTTTIRYELPEDGLVTIKLYDILGQEVTTILNEFKKADRYEVKFNAGGLASGVYIYRMKVNDLITSKKMILLR